MSKFLLQSSLILALVFCLLPASAQVDTFEFETDEQQRRFRNLSNELRCPMCQYSNLTGSAGGVAEDLRREVHRMIMAGMSDSEIEQFMFERYGDYIFFRPRFRIDTVLLWFGPLIFLVIGGLVVANVVKKSRSTPADSLGEDELKRLNELLDRK